MENWETVTNNAAYEVSTYGRVRKTSTKALLSTWTNRRGDLFVVLYNPLKQRQQNYKVSILVANTFFDIKNPRVIHKDGDRTNCSVANLLCCNHVEICEYTYGKRVVAWGDDFCNHYPSVKKAAQDFNMTAPAVISACKRETPTRNGVRFAYED